MDFYGMKRKDLQTLCKKHGIPGNLKNIEMASRLTSVFQKEMVIEEKNSPEDSVEADAMKDDIVESGKGKKATVIPQIEVCESTRSVEEIQQEKEEEFVDEEVERNIAAIRAIRDVNIEEMVTQLRLLRSYYTDEQLKMPVLEFFKENLPDLTISRNEANREIQLKWRDEDSSMDNGEDMNYSILRRLSVGFPDFYSTKPFSGYDLPDNVKASLLDTDNTHLENLVFPGSFETQKLTNHDALRTPGQSVSGDPRMSVGMTPKTRRQPKAGEMMLSVHGSPLGVYQEDGESSNNNMGAINEENT